MAEVKSCRILINVEPTFYGRIVSRSINLGISMSSYVRGLLIAGMRAEGTLNDTEILDVFLKMEDNGKCVE